MGIFTRKKPEQVAWNEVIDISRQQKLSDRKQIAVELDKIQRAEPEVFSDIKKRLQENSCGKIEIGFNIRDDRGADFAGRNLITKEGSKLAINLDRGQVERVFYDNNGKFEKASLTQTVAHELSRASDRDYFRNHELHERANAKALKYFSGFAEYCEKKGVDFKTSPADRDAFLDEVNAVRAQHPELSRAYALRNPISYLSFSSTAHKAERGRASSDEDAVERSNSIMQKIEPSFAKRTSYTETYEVRKAEVADISETAKQKAAELATSTGGKIAQDVVPKALPFDAEKAKAAVARK